PRLLDGQGREPSHQASECPVVGVPHPCAVVGEPPVLRNWQPLPAAEIKTRGDYPHPFWLCGQANHRLRGADRSAASARRREVAHQNRDRGAGCDSAALSPHSRSGGEESEGRSSSERSPDQKRCRFTVDRMKCTTRSLVLSIV